MKFLMRRQTKEEKQLRMLVKRFPDILENLKANDALGRLEQARRLARERIDVNEVVGKFLKAKTNWGRERHISLLEIVGDDAIIFAARKALSEEKPSHINTLIPRMCQISEKNPAKVEEVDLWWEGIARWQNSLVYWRVM